MTKQQQSSNVALLFVKMASVMGVTWIFGIAAYRLFHSSLQGKCLGQRKNGTFSSLESPDTIVPT